MFVFLAINCGPPPRPPPAYQIVHEEGYNYKNKIYLRCSKGYISAGEIFMRCQANGRYSRVTNHCNSKFLSFIKNHFQFEQRKFYKS